MSISLDDSHSLWKRGTLKWNSDWMRSTEVADADVDAQSFPRQCRLNTRFSRTRDFLEPYREAQRVDGFAKDKFSFLKPLEVFRLACFLKTGLAQKCSEKAMVALHRQMSSEGLLRARLWLSFCKMSAAPSCHRPG